jgi:vancomycin resistance protein YoaR
MITQIKKQVTIQQRIYALIIVGLSFIFIGLFMLGNFYNDKLFPNTYINSINVSGLQLTEGINLLERHRIELDSHEFILNMDDVSLASSSAELGYTTDFNTTIKEVYLNQHTNNKVLNSINALLAFIKTNNNTASQKYDKNKRDEFLTQFNQKIELVGEDPSVALKINNSPNSIVVFSGKPGRELERKTTEESIISALQNDQYQVTAKIASTSSVLNKQEIDTTIYRATKFLGKELTIIAEDKKFYLNDKELVGLIDPISDYKQEDIMNIISNWADKSNRQPQNAVFEYDQTTLDVKEFSPHRDGLEVIQDESLKLLKSWLVNTENQKSDNENSQNADNQVSNNLLLTLKKTQPEITLDKTNDLGINQRIGFGESYYHHSIINRVHNVGITAERISLVIVPPGEEFSFNKTLGEISKRTGYRSAYVISGGRTILGDGGGVCQVSSTLFRSVLDAGLDVSKRLQHSYRVSYYELNSKPGFDATVYSGDVDFRFINDTPAHIMLLSYNNSEDLYMNIEIYGTDDGRSSEIHDYKKWGQVGPPATEYIPTTDLPTGVRKQVDWSVSGVKTEFTNTVKDKDGNILHDDTYYSNYRPWSAKYMVGI